VEAGEAAGFPSAAEPRIKALIRSTVAGSKLAKALTLTSSPHR
jgi:hypothetical protein